MAVPRNRVLWPKKSIFNKTDVDASNYIDASLITDPAKIYAIDRKVKNLKGRGNLNASVDVWSDDIAIYILGGLTALEKRLNLKNPVNSDAAFRLNFFGISTHDAIGTTGNGINSFIDTNIIPATHLSLNNFSFSVGVESNTVGNQVEVGVQSSGGAYISMITRFTGDASGARVNSSSAFTSATSTDSRGFHTGNRLNNTTEQHYKGGGLVRDRTINSTALSTHRIFIQAESQNNIANFFSTKKISSARFGAGKTPEKISLLNAIELQYKTDLGL